MPCFFRYDIGSVRSRAAGADVALYTITRPNATRASVTRTSRCDSSCAFFTTAPRRAAGTPHRALRSRETGHSSHRRAKAVRRQPAPHLLQQRPPPFRGPRNGGTSVLHGPATPRDALSPRRGDPPYASRRASYSASARAPP